MKSGAIRGEQVFQVCHLTTIAILFNNYDYNALSTELKRGTLFSEYTLLFTLPFMITIGGPFLETMNR